MTTVTEKYIKKAVTEAKKELGGNSFSNIHIEMNLQADGATELLAEALLAQAKANESNSESMRELAKSLKHIDVSAIKIVNNKLEPCS